MFRKVKTVVAGAILAATPLLTLLVPGVAHALPTDYCQWNGSTSTAWNTAANWTAVGAGCAGGVPSTGDNLVFGNVAAANAPTNNDITGLSVASIDFEAVDAGQALGGNAFTLTGNVTNNTGSSNNIGNNVAISSASVMDIGNMAAVNFTGVVSGSGNITKQGAGDVDFVGGFTNTGALTVNAGQVFLLVQSAADFTGSSITVASGATLAYDAFDYSGFSANYTLSKPITTAGTLDFSAINGAGDVHLTGTLTLTGDTVVKTLSGIIVHIEGALQGPGFKVTATGAGQVLNESTSNNTDTPTGDVNGAGVAADGGLTAPDTGFAMASTHPGVTLAITLVSAAAIFTAARMTRKSASRR